MKCIFTLLLICSITRGIASPTVYEKLCELNKCWKEQQDFDVNALQYREDLGERELIRLHLTKVEQTTRARSTSGLTEQQRTNRARALDELQKYRVAGAFPINDEYNYRTPIFIDKYDNFCAVGHLMKVTGYEHLSRKIAANTNLGYVKEMNYPEIIAWANEFGFTLDELAWIQPAYFNPPDRTTIPIGDGTNGEVMELYVDSASQILYVGGDFSLVDSFTPASNIAYVTESGGFYTWHTMGSGVNGTVKAIAKYNNNIFVAGSFTMAGSVSVNNVAYWDGNAWHPAGCIYGAVNDLIVYNGELYAAGDFDVCAAMSEVNFAKWNGTVWQQVIGLTGHVNTMQVMDSFLMLGGAFSHGSAGNAIKWNVNTSFLPFSNNIMHEVNDFEEFRDTMYAVCKQTTPGDLKLLHYLDGDTWDTVQNSFLAKCSLSAPLSLNTLCAWQDTLLLGGRFHNLWSPPQLNFIGVANSYDLTSGTASNNYFMVDSAINKMVSFKGSIIAGGKFKRESLFFRELNGLARQTEFCTITTPVISVAGSNSACSGTTVNYTATTNVTSGKLDWKVNGQTVATNIITYAYSPANGDIVSAEVSDLYYQCFNTPSATSNTITMSIAPTSTPTLTLSGPGSDIPGSTVTINAAITNGPPIYSIDWKNNNVLFATTTTSSVSYTKGAGTDVITAVLTALSGCFDTVTSGAHTVGVIAGVTEEMNAQGIEMYPNPVENRLTLNGLRQKDKIILIDMQGKVSAQWNAAMEEEELNLQHVIPGHYVLRIIGSKGETRVNIPLQKR